MLWKWKSWKAVPVVALAALTLLSACGKKEFQKLNYTSSAVAGQYIYIKPKLDLVVFQDNSDSMANAMNVIKPQLNNFLSSLSSSWDYRVVVLPLLSQQSLGSKYVVATDCTGVNAGRCLSPGDVAFFNSQIGDSSWITSRNTAVGNNDQGFFNMNGNIDSLNSSSFLRSDAALAMVVISNNDDHTNVSYATRPDGSTVGIDYTSATTINSFNYYKNYFLGLKTSIKLNKFYAVVVGNTSSDQCSGGGAVWTGKRYMDMASALGGATFDLCNGGLSQVLNDIGGQLQVVVQTIIFNYVKISDVEPDPNSIKITKNGVAIPNSATNGWTYVGYLANQATSYSPVLGNYKSGYMVRLNGTAEIKGSDAITIDYQKK